MPCPSASFFCVTEYHSGPLFGPTVFCPRATGAFNLLPFVEQQQIRDMGPGVQDSAAKADQAVIRLSTPLAVFTCPSRRPATLWPVVAGRQFRVTSVPSVENRRLETIICGDYAGNMGSGDRCSHPPWARVRHNGVRLGRNWPRGNRETRSAAEKRRFCERGWPRQRGLPTSEFMSIP